MIDYSYKVPLRSILKYHIDLGISNLNNGNLQNLKPKILCYELLISRCIELVLWHYRDTIEKIIDFNFAANYNSYFSLSKGSANYISLFWGKLQLNFKHFGEN
jgi:hypothetical protein